MSKDLTHITTQYKIQAFWDVPLESIHFKEHKDFVIERILQYGGLDGVQWIFKNYDRQSIKHVVMTSRVILRQ